MKLFLFGFILLSFNVFSEDAFKLNVYNGTKHKNTFKLILVQNKFSITLKKDYFLMSNSKFNLIYSNIRMEQKNNTFQKNKNINIQLSLVENQKKDIKVVYVITYIDFKNIKHTIAGFKIFFNNGENKQILDKNVYYSSLTIESANISKKPDACLYLIRGF